MTDRHRKSFEKTMYLLKAGIVLLSLLVGFLIYQLIRDEKDMAFDLVTRYESKNVDIYIKKSQMEQGRQEVTDIENAGERFNTEKEEGMKKDVKIVRMENDIVSMKNALYTYEQMMGDLKLLERRYPDRISIGEAGVSLDGRKIMEVILGNQRSPKHIMIQASIHGREYMNTLLAMRQLEDILKNFENGSYHGASLKGLFDNVCFHILPMANPDGVTISQRGPEGIRDSTLREQVRNCYRYDLENGEAGSSLEEFWRRWKANARGVDLNRNFDSGWEEYQSVTYPSSDHYKGELPESEPEVQAILRLVDEYPIVCTISYHSSGEVVYWDYGSSGNILEADRELADLVSTITGYSKESSVQSAQDAAGCSDYLVLEQGIPSVTIENGSGECPLSIEEFDSIWNSNYQLWPALAEQYGG